jgi:hypothetical protein
MGGKYCGEKTAGIYQKSTKVLDKVLCGIIGQLTFALLKFLNQLAL